jgi:fumarate reductase subunit C
VSAPIPPYSRYHPRWYRARVSTWWWLGRPSYVAFILRELSSVFVAWSVVFLLLLVRAVGKGSSSYADFLDWAGTPWVVVLNVVTLAFVVYHAVTWFQLTPAAMVVRLRGRRLPGAAIAASAYAGWVVVSAFVAGLLLRG